MVAAAPCLRSLVCVFSTVTFSGPGPWEIGRGASSCWVWVFFLKTEQDKKQVEPVSLGVGYFTSLLRDFLFALRCWEADKLKYCSREAERSWGG